MPFDAHPADVDRETWLRDELALLQDEIGQMVDRGSWQAVVSGRRLALQYRTEIDALRLAQPSEAFEPTTPDEIVAEMLKMPDAVWADPRIQDRVAKCA